MRKAAKAVARGAAARAEPTPARPIGNDRFSNFSRNILAWHPRGGRKNLPWQGTRDPYRIWLSEIMLQQTQVATVLPYYDRFLARFPDIAALAASQEDEVLRLWSGLGYYSRARNLQRAARLIASQHRGEFPRNLDAITALPGVGRSTAAAIAAFAFGTRAAILDGNVKRVLARYHAVEGYPGDKPVESELWRLAEMHTPPRRISAYTQAIMDLGATVCTRHRPACKDCPLRRDCRAYAAGRVSELPARKPPRSVRKRKVTMLLLMHGQGLLLEKRAPTGIWGGLWSLPEVSDDRDLVRHCRMQFGCHIGATTTLETVDHSFTHFKLEIRPVLCTVDRIESGVAQPGHVWLPAREAQDAGVPAPVRKLILRLSARRARG